MRPDSVNTHTKNDPQEWGPRSTDDDSWKFLPIFQWRNVIDHSKDRARAGGLSHKSSQRASKGLSGLAVPAYGRGSIFEMTFLSTS